MLVRAAERRVIHAAGSARRRPFSLCSSGGAEEKAAVGVFWDFENCPVPSSLDPFLFRPNIERALRNSGLLGPISFSGYGNIHLISRSHVLEALSETGIDLHHVPSGGKNSSDRALLIDMLLWTFKHSPPANVLLISGDSDFSAVLHKMCLLSYNVLLAAPSSVSMPSALVSAASRVWGWPEMATGEVGLGQVPPSGMPLPHNNKDYSSRGKEFGLNKPAMNWGEDMKQPPFTGNEDIFATSRDGLPRTSEGVCIPVILMNKIVSMVEENPGTSLGEISKELRSMSINPRSFGFTSFYHLLASVGQLETQFIDGISMKDRATYYLAAGKDARTSAGGSPGDKRPAVVAAAGSASPLKRLWDLFKWN